MTPLDCARELVAALPAGYLDPALDAVGREQLAGLVRDAIEGAVGLVLAAVDADDGMVRIGDPLSGGEYGPNVADRISAAAWAVAGVGP